MSEKRIIQVDFPKKRDSKAKKIPKIRVAAYARVSTELDAQQNSLKAQTDYFVRLIKANAEWTFAGLYADDGISGLSYRRRDGFNRMVQDALDGRIDRILTKSLSRFARNTVDALTTIRKLKAVGVAIYFEKENIDTLDSRGEFLITLMSSFAEEESRSMSENITWAKRHYFAQGKYSVAFSTFLGYRRGRDGDFEIDETQAAVARYIYWLALQGISGYGICTALECKNIPAPAGGANWETSTVYSILQNEKYMGDARLQKSYTVDFLNKKLKTNEGEVSQYYVENGHPAIISKSVWHEVQENWTAVLDRTTTVNPFSGRIICGDCGGSYGRMVWHSTTTHDIVWECIQKKTGKTNCGCSHIYEYELEAAMNHLWKRLRLHYSDVFEQCAIFCQNELHIELDEIEPDRLHLDDVAVRLLIVCAKITNRGNAVFHMIDGSCIRYNLNAPTPLGRPGNAASKRNRLAIGKLHSSGMGPTAIAKELGISVNTVKSYLRRHRLR